MKNGIVVFFLAMAILLPSLTSAFTVVHRSDQLYNYIYLRKQFVNQNVFPSRVDWVQIRINLIPPVIVRGSYEERFSVAIRERYENIINSFLLVMENDNWLRAGYFNLERSPVSDGEIRMDHLRDPRFILQLNGRERGVYYNPKMNFEGYFRQVNQKILFRLSNAVLHYYSF